MNDPNPIPRDFGWRYVGWLAWTNLITILGTVQGVVGALALDDQTFQPHTIHYFLIANAVLTVVVAQVKRNRPPPPPPLKDQKP